MKSKILVTGIGLITPFGTGLRPVLDGIKQGKSACGPLVDIDCSTLPIKVGGWISEDRIQLSGLLHNKLRGMGKYVKLGVQAAREAIEDAGLDLKRENSERIGAFVSSGTHGHNAEGLFGAFDAARGADDALDLSNLSREGIDRVHPWWLLSTISNNLIFFVTHFFGIKGPNTNFCNSAVGGAYALDRALESFDSGEIDIALVGGADCPLNWQILSDFSLLKFLAEGAPSEVLPWLPYSPVSRGAVLAEAAVFLMCETEAHAAQRNARIYAEIKAASFSGAFQHEIHPAEDGRETLTALRELLSEIPAGEPVQVNTSAVGVPAWDSAEMRGIAQVDRKAPLLLGSAKPWLGHAFSASFLLETAVSIGALVDRTGIPYPKAGENALTMPFLPANAGNIPHRWAINLGQCFGGNTAGVLLRGV